MKKNLGLDLGTNSIGWGIVENDIENGNNKILGIGSRIIPMSQEILGKFDSGNSVSQTAERRGFRGARRLFERNHLRRERLHRVLNVIGFLPEHYTIEIDFEIHFGKFFENSEPKIAYKFNIETNKNEFIFQKSFGEMLEDFKNNTPELLEGGNKIPYDWTIYYLRKKALTQKIEKEELSWILLNFNQKRGYYQLRGEEEVENPNKLVELYSLKVVEVVADDKPNNKGEMWYSIKLENGWIYRRTSKIPLDNWLGKIRDFIVTSDINDDGTIKKNKEGSEKRSIRSPGEDDWTIVKKKTEKEIKIQNKTVGCYIYDTLLKEPTQKIKGKLVRTIERDFYKDELELILEKQIEFHKELRDSDLLKLCSEELYRTNENYREKIISKDFLNLFLNDIIFYQRPLKSKKSLISNCSLEIYRFKDKEGNIVEQPIKCIPKSHPLFVEFRLLQFVQNLKIYEKDKKIDGVLKHDFDVTNEFLKTYDDWNKLYEWLNDREKISQKTLFNSYFKIKAEKNEELEYRWNYVEEKEYPCNETRHNVLIKLKKLNIPDSFLKNDNEIKLWHILYSVEDKNDIEKALKTFATAHSVDNIDYFVELFKKFPRINKVYGSFSEKAIKKLLPLMRIGKYWNEESIDLKTRERIEKIISGEFDESIKNRVREKAINLETAQDFQGLPLWLSSYIVYNRHSEASEIEKWESPSDIDKYLNQTFKHNMLRNPIVEQVITETLRVVKDIWVKYGNSEKDYFDEIHIELGREMKNNAEDRKAITKNILNNENTNLRLKKLLIELYNSPEIENVRPNSPSQLEILKIFEEGAILSKEKNDDIEKIIKNPNPTQSELNKYKLWLEQSYRSPYTGEVIPLSRLFTTEYQIEHIIPQSKFFDDSLSNKVICEAEVNSLKNQLLGYEFINEHGGEKVTLNYGRVVEILKKEEYENFVNNTYSKNNAKRKKLLMLDIPEKFIERQLNDTRYISKYIKNLLSNIVRQDGEMESTSKNVLSSNGGITTKLKQDWGLNDVWNSIISSRFERLNEITNSNNFGYWDEKDGKRYFQTQVPLELQKNFNKKRIDHRHHSVDALVIACATKNHINFLNNEHAKSKEEELRFDLRNKLCIKKYNDGSNYKWIFKKPWDTFTQDAKNCIEKTVVSFKQNLRVVNKTKNIYQKLEKDENGNVKKIFIKQVKGDMLAIRKPLHKETVAGRVNMKFKKSVQLSAAIDNYANIVDKSLKNKIKYLVNQNLNKTNITKYFKELNYKWNDKDINRVEVYYFDDNYTANRVFLDTTFNVKNIDSITDSGIRKIVLKHLENCDNNSELAFSPEGIEVMNKNIVELNNGKNHKPILKVRVFETMGKKFQVGYKGNKMKKWVVAATGTNLYFAIYIDEEGKRDFESVPFNQVIENTKLDRNKPIQEFNSKGNKLLFSLSPNDLVYVPNSDEIENPNSVDFDNLTKEQVNRIYKVVSFSGNQLFLIQNCVSYTIWNKNEFSSLNKMEKSNEGIMIKNVCWKLKVDRLGKIIDNKK